MIDRQTVLHYVELYRNLERRRGLLVLPGWMKQALDALPADDRESILHDVDAIAAQHGLETPVDIKEYE